MTRDLRLLPIAGVAWGSALFSVFVPSSIPWIVCGCGVLGVLLVALLLRRRGKPVRIDAGVILVAVAAGAAMALSAGMAASSRESAASWYGRVVEVTGDVTSSASVGADGRLWVDLQITGLGVPGEPEPLSAPARVGVDPGSGFDLGAGLRIVGQAAATEPGERAALVIFATTATVERPASGVFAVSADLKSAFVARSTRLPEPGAGLLPGLAIGDTRAVDAELDEAMRASGLSHLTAVSGANCAIVVGAAFWLTALCGAGRMLRVLCAALTLAGFVVIVTPEPSVVRAAVMAGVGMLTLLIGRPSAGAGLLSLCAVIILLADPWLAATPGFALSVAASGALVLLAPPLARGMERWMPRPVALAIAVPLAAQLVCGPTIALFAEQQSLIGVAANIVAGPAAPLATVIGLLACLAAPVPVVADLLTACSWLPAAWIATTATVSADLPLAQVALVPGLGSAVVVAVLSTATTIVLLRPPRASGGVRRRVAWVRRASAAVIVIVLALGGARMLLSGPLATASTPEDWAIAACDVGQGDALVVRSDDAVALIDTGPDPEPLEICLRELGIDRIDLLILTHFDLDHAGGVEAVRGRVDRVLHSPPGGQDDAALLAGLAGSGADLVDATAGLDGVLGGASWKVLWPRSSSAGFPPGNDASVAVEFSGGGVPTSIFLGDLSAEAQRMLLRTAKPGAVAVVKVAHHGSADQEPSLYEALRPAAALISVGEGNDYGHPRDEILDVLQALGAHILRTDQQGRILLGIRDGALAVWTQKSVGGPG